MDADASESGTGSEQLEYLVTLLRFGSKKNRRTNLNNALRHARTVDATPEAIAHVLAAGKAAGCSARLLAHEAIKTGVAEPRK